MLNRCRAKAARWAFTMGLVASLGACGDDDRGRSRDAETGAMDAAAGAADGSGALDAATEEDAETAQDASTELDADASQDAGPVDLCPDIPVMPNPGIPCSASAKSCADACDSFDCVFECMDADSMDCGNCADQNFIACANRNGCQDAWDCSTKCTRERCPTFDPTCVAAMCMAEEDAFVECVLMLDDRCSERILDCLPEA